MREDFRYAWRGIRKNPVFSIIAVLTLAIGIGANTAIFSVIEAVLLHSLPFGDARRVYRIDRYYPDASKTRNLPLAGRDVTIPWQSPPDVLDIEQQSHSYSGTAVVRFVGEQTLTGISEPRGVLTAAATPNFFSVLQFEPQLGRAFSDAEADQQAHVVVLTNEFWRSEFGGNPAAVGQNIQLDRETYRIVGVLPPHLLILPRIVAIFRPLSMAQLPPEIKTQRAMHSQFLYARLAPGVSDGQAQAELNIIAARLRKQYPKTEANQELTLVNLRQVVAGSVRPALLMLMGAVGLVLLIACANLSSMLLARAAGRQREFAIRMSLGAGRLKIARQLLIEALILAALGGSAGLLLAAWMVSLLTAIAPADLPAAGAIGLNVPVLLFTAAVICFAALLSGGAPALHLDPGRIAGALTERLLTGRRETARARTLITVAELGLALVLMIGAGLLIKNFARVYHQDPGFRTRGLLTFYISFDTAHKQPAAAALLMQNLQQHWRALPGVQDAGFTTDLPLNSTGSDLLFMIAGRPLPTSMADSPDALFHAATPGYIQAVGLQLKAGRAFTDRDTLQSQPVVLINDALARRYFPGENPIGQHLTLGTPFAPELKDIGEREIVGVLSDAHIISLHQPDKPTLYVPFAQVAGVMARFIYGGAGVAVSAATDPAQLQSAVTAVVHRAAPEIPVSSLRTGTQLVASDLAPERFNLFLLSTFATIGMFLASIGIYGVMAYSVAQRRAEVGVRVAFGAQRRDILRLIVGSGMRLTAAGLLIGIAGAVALSRLMQQFIYDMSATDPATFIAVVVVFAAVALAANLVPSLRALQVDPVEVLRSE